MVRNSAAARSAMPARKRLKPILLLAPIQGGPGEPECMRRVTDIPLVLLECADNGALFHRIERGDVRPGRRGLVEARCREGEIRGLEHHTFAEDYRTFHRVP